MLDNGYYRNRLNEEMSLRVNRNPSYSLRAFAKSLGIDAGLLSKVLSSKRNLTVKSAQKIVEKMDLDPSEKQMFLRSVIEEKTNQSLDQSGVTPAETMKKEDLDLDSFRMIADLHHSAIMELTYVKDFKPEPRWIAQQLGISVFEAQTAFDRLLRLGFLVKKGKKVEKAHSTLMTTDRTITRPALKKHQHQALSKAIDSLHEDPIEKRNMTSVTFAMDPQKIPTAKKKIQEFMEELTQYLESGNRKKVYELTVNLFPLQKDME